jgi:alpha,alpha-trehalase
MIRDPAFTPLSYHDGYLPIEDHGLIGDGTTAALVARDGAVSWLCLPRFDGFALFCALLDTGAGGSLRVWPEGLVEARQYYETDTAVLVTEMRTSEGLVRVRDGLGLRDDADLLQGEDASLGALLRSVDIIGGRVRLRLSIDCRGGAEVVAGSSGLRIRASRLPDLELLLTADRHLDGPEAAFDMSEGEGLELALLWPGPARSSDGDRSRVVLADAAPAALPRDRGCAKLLDRAAAIWRRWMQSFEYSGPETRIVRRSAITLKLMDNFANGAILAAPTSSLPEAIGGTRNWDYRYSWIRDAAFGVYALRRIGMVHEAEGFLRWVLDAFETGDRPRVLYDIDGRLPAEEFEDTALRGYRDSPPVRWGNAAVEQKQHDVYGEIVDCAYQWAAHGGGIDAELWGRLLPLIEAAGRDWRTTDHGIWEVRTSGRPFTYSAALCQVALDRGARLVDRLGLPGRRAWRGEAETIRDAILNEAWDEKQKSLTEHLGGGGIDASLLSLPLRRVIPPDHPRMIATTAAVTSHLGAGQGLVYRYIPEESPDGLPGHEGAFLLCSFWLVDNLAYQGRLEEAFDLYASLCARGGHLGLLPEQIDPPTGAFLGNYPQAFSHVGVIASGVKLGRLGGEV